MKLSEKLKKYYACNNCLFIWVTISRNSDAKNEQCPECGSFNPKRITRRKETSKE